MAASIIEMQGAVTLGDKAQNQRRHAVEAGTHRLSQGGQIARFEDVFSFENLYEAGKSCCNGVRWKASTQVFETRLPSWCADIRAQLLNGSWRSKGFTSFTICERGKVRHIQACHISERMVQKCLVKNCLRPVVLPRLIYDSHATIPGHGVEFALKRLKEHLRWHYARNGNDGFVVVMDYHDYFGSIDHELLKQMYSRLPIDQQCYDLTCYLIDRFPGNKGLGLGSEISQLSAVLYASVIDHLAKDRLGVHCYGRYMDDSYAIFATRDEAEDFLARIRVESAELGLNLNDKVTKIKPLKHGFRYLKKRIFITTSGRVVMRMQRDNVVRERRRIKRNLKALADGKIDASTERQSFESWASHGKRINAYTTIRAMGKFRKQELASQGFNA